MKSQDVTLHRRTVFRGFQNYNLAIWPMQVIAYLCGIAVLFLAIKRLAEGSQLHLADSCTLVTHRIFGGNLSGHSRRHRALGCRLDRHSADFDSRSATSDGDSRASAGKRRTLSGCAAHRISLFVGETGCPDYAPREVSQANVENRTEGMGGAGKLKPGRSVETRTVACPAFERFASHL